MDKLNQSFPDPAQFKKEEEFIYAAKMSSVFKKVVSEIINWVELHKDEAKRLKEKETEVDKFAIGR